MQPLQPAKKYYYKFGSSDGGWSEVYSFVAPRVPGDATPFTFLYAPTPPCIEHKACMTAAAGTLRMQALETLPARSRAERATMTRL